jgi:hypothetical protein
MESRGTVLYCTVLYCTVVYLRIRLQYVDISLAMKTFIRFSMVFSMHGKVSNLLCERWHGRTGLGYMQQQHNSRALTAE